MHESVGVCAVSAACSCSRARAVAGRGGGPSALLPRFVSKRKVGRRRVARIKGEKVVWCRCAGFRKNVSFTWR